MDQEKIGKFIKKIRKDNNLTQAAFAEKYGVTYQAVSKWENGKNVPDIALLKEISKDFNVSIDDILKGEVTSLDEKDKTKSNKYKIVLVIVLVIFILILLVIIFNRNSNFEFKTISSDCDNFNVSGSIAYNDSKSSIYISNINYCGGDDNNYYKKIECTLYEVYSNTRTEISRYDYDSDKALLLEDFFKNVKLHIDNYSRICKQYSSDSLFLQIDATMDDGKVISYKVPLSFEDNCLKE